VQLHERTFTLTHLPAGFAVANIRVTPASVFAIPQGNRNTASQFSDAVTAILARPPAQGVGPTDPVPTVSVTIRVATARAAAVRLLDDVKGHQKGRVVTLAGHPGYLYQVDDRWRSVLLVNNTTVITVSSQLVSDEELLAVAQGVRG
jgi:hypothetical protein